VELEPRISKLESSHIILVQEFKQINRTLEKIELAIEKQASLMSDLRVLTNKIDSQDKRISDIESALSRVVWLVVTAVLGALLALILK
jgi:predicted  nucleic acid-binding Zn-ribbon protein